jgi:preprotein translocase subunit SecE
MNKVVVFLKEVKSELGKVTWPRRDELIGSTIIVFLLVIFLGAYLGIVDTAFSVLIKKLFMF